MKKSALLLFIFCALIACKKDKKATPATLAPQPALAAKWHDKFVGKYKGTFTSVPYGSSIGLFVAYTKDTTLSIKADANELMNDISFSASSVIQFDSTNTAQIIHGNISYVNDSLYYKGDNGGLGGGQAESFSGKKISNTP